MSDERGMGGNGWGGRDGGGNRSTNAIWAEEDGKEIFSIKRFRQELKRCGFKTSENLKGRRDLLLHLAEMLLGEEWHHHRTPVGVYVEKWYVDYSELERDEIEFKLDESDLAFYLAEV